MEKGSKKCKTNPVKSTKTLSKKAKEVLNAEEDSEALYNRLKAEEERLDKEIAELEKQGIDSNLKPQMEALHKYNEMKDVTQIVLGYLADTEQTTVAELHKLYKLPLD